MIRQPPTAVPSEMAVADDDDHPGGHSIVAIRPAEKSARVMMPIVFCASFEPCENAMKLADTTCSRRKTVVIGRDAARRKKSQQQDR